MWVGPVSALAAAFLEQGLIDEISIYVPVVGERTPMFQGATETLQLERLDERALANGVVFVRYRVRNRAARS